MSKANIKHEAHVISQITMLPKNTGKVYKMNEIIEITENKQLKEDNLQISHINALRAENEILRDENETLFETNEALIKTIRELRAKINSLESDKITLENKLANVTLGDLNPEQQEAAGHALARDLLGKPMTPSDIAEEEFIANGEALYEATWNINCGDDF